VTALDRAGDPHDATRPWRLRGPRTVHFALVATFDAAHLIQLSAVLDHVRDNGFAISTLLDIGLFELAGVTKVAVNHHDAVASILVEK
jgi:hypothetical protein